MEHKEIVHTLALRDARDKIRTLEIQIASQREMPFELSLRREN
jgi:hypothetical protein